MSILNNNTVLLFLIGKMQHGVAICDINYNILLWNEAAAKIIGAAPTPANSSKWVTEHNFLHRDGTELMESDMALYRAMSEQNESAIETIYRKDGKDVYLNSRAYPLYDDDNNLVGAVAFIQDVTNQIIIANLLKEVADSLNEIQEYLNGFRI